MKKCVVILMIGILSQGAGAQTWEEWTQQKKTGIKYLLEQIVALKVYGEHLKNGYDIVQEGLSTMHAIKQGDYDLHEGFFSALKLVNPTIRKDPRLAAMASMQVSIVKQCHHILQWAKRSKQLNTGEIAYIGSVTSHLLQGGTRVIDALILLTTDGAVELGDDERLGRIDALFEEIEDQYLFAKQFSREIKILAVQRAKEQKAVGQGRSLHALK